MQIQAAIRGGGPATPAKQPKAPGGDKGKGPKTEPKLKCLPGRAAAATLLQAGRETHSYGATTKCAIFQIIWN